MADGTTLPRLRKRIVMLWWAIAIAGGWLATGALIPVLWKLSGLVSAEEPVVTAVPVVGAASIVETAAPR